MQICVVHLDDFTLYIVIIAPASSNKQVQNRIAKTEAVFVRHTTQAIRWGLINQIGGQTQGVPDGQDFGDGIALQRRKVSCCITILGGISDRKSSP